MRRISASKLPIVMECPGSMALPWVTEPAGEPAERGSAIHAFLAAVGSVGREAALDQVPAEYLEACEEIDLDRLPTHLAAEVAYALDLVTGKARELGRDLGRAYPETSETEIVGTADLVGLDADCVHVYDYKTGWSEQAPAGQHWQLIGLAVMAARAIGADSARIGVIQLRDGRSWWDVAELDAIALDAAFLRLQQMREKALVAETQVADGRVPDLRTGPHCRYCPAALSCPAQVGMIRAAAAAPEEITALGEALTLDTAAKAYRRIREVRAVLGKVEAQIHALASREPIPLGDGMVLGLVSKTKESINGDVALPLLREKYGEAAEQAVEVSITKARLKDALRIVAKSTGAKITHLEKEALALLREHDGIQTKTSETVAEYKETA